LSARRGTGTEDDINCFLPNYFTDRQTDRQTDNFI